jgi:hypothetical protein
VEEHHVVASQRVEHAKRRFVESWAYRWIDPRAVEQDLDELDVAVGLWLDAEEAARRASGRIDQRVPVAAGGLVATFI